MNEALQLAAIDGIRLAQVAEEELVERGRFTPAWRRSLARLTFSAAERLNFYRALAVYRAQDVREGAALVSWWNVITVRGSKKLWHPLAILIPVLLYAMHYQGARWQSLFKKWVPADDAMIITASERAGLTPQLLDTLMSLSVARREWSRKIRSAVLPAAINLGWLLGLLAGIGLFYFPALQRSMPHMRIVGKIAVLADLSKFVNDYGLCLIAALAAFPFVVKILLQGMTGPGRAAIDGLPGFSLYRQATGMTFLLGISALLDVGENFIDSVKLLRGNATPYVRERLDGILAYDDLRPAEAMVATGFHWPDDATLELLTLYMVTKSPQEGIRVLVDDWFERAGDSYARIAVLVNSLGQLASWGLIGWLYLVTSELTTTMAR
jgi:hypothetical protein